MLKKGIFDNILSSRKRILTHISQIMDANVHVSATLVAANIYSWNTLSNDIIKCYLKCNIGIAYKLCTCVCLYICVCAHIAICLCVKHYVCEGQRTTFDIIPFSLNMELTYSSRLATQGSFSLHLSRAGITNAHHYFPPRVLMFTCQTFYNLDCLPNP